MTNHLLLFPDLPASSITFVTARPTDSTGLTAPPPLPGSVQVGPLRESHHSAPIVSNLQVLFICLLFYKWRLESRSIPPAAADQRGSRLSQRRELHRQDAKARRDGHVDHCPRNQGLNPQFHPLLRVSWLIFDLPHLFLEEICLPCTGRP